MPVVWPASLPQSAFMGLEEEAEPNVIDTPMAAGPAKRRRRSTKERVFQTTPLEITGAQRTTFETFWGNIDHGAEPFEWTDLLTGATVEFRLLRKPRWQIRVGASDPDKRIYEGVLYLERL